MGFYLFIFKVAIIKNQLLLFIQKGYLNQINIQYQNFKFSIIKSAIIANN